MTGNAEAGMDVPASAPSVRPTRESWSTFDERWDAALRELGLSPR